ncbi:MAG: aldehyde ferredoxin oxidoreductase family protein [Thermosphaera sp.]
MIHKTQLLLRIDLSNHKIEEEEIQDNIVEKFVGGKGLASYFMYKELKPRIDPYSPENKLFVFNGPLAYIYPTFTRTVVASKSPLTNLFCDSYAGGSFGLELRRAGYSGIIVEGRSDRIVCLKVTRDEKTLIDCESLRGKTTYEVGDFFKDYSTLTIGPAGENLVRYAGVYIDLRRSPDTRPGVAGRGGLGAVLGSKNLKAIVVKGWLKHDELTVGVNATRRQELINKYLDIIKRDVVPGIGIGGNLPVFKVAAESKILPVKNFQQGVHENWEELTDDSWSKVTTKRITCPTCPIACGDTIVANGESTERIEYETVAMDGSNLLIISRKALTKINTTLNALGLDTISTGSVLAFMTELAEKGVVKDFNVKWGDLDSYLKLMNDIAHRRGVGDLLAEGVARIAKHLSAEETAVHVKGLEIPAYDPRGVVGMSLAYATADRGGDHLRAWTVASELSTSLSPEGLVDLVKYLQDRNAALWTLIACDNIPGNSIKPPDEIIKIYIDMLNTLGFNFDYADFLKMGERIYNLTRLFNVREGVGRREDDLPLRFYQPRKDTGWVIKKEDFEKMLNLYYAKRGWSESGVPLDETLKRLGLTEYVSVKET